ncbi:MAG: hypothetical protein ACRDK3_10075, partial [Actinomycetota bacterium]
EDGERTALVETTKRETGKRKLHELVAGDRFRVVFKLTSMDKRCASFLYGDEWFALCERQRIVRK